MNKTKVLFADHTPFVGGAQLRLAEDISFLDKKKFEAAVVIDKDSAFSALYENLSVPIFKISFPKLKLISPVALTRFISSVKEFQNLVIKASPNVVVANTTRTLVVAGLAKRLFGLQFHLISYIRDYDYPKWIFRLIKKQVNKYLFVSASVQNYYRLPGEVIYLGSDIESKYKNITNQEVIKIKKSLNITKSDFVIGFIGRLVNWKGAMQLVKSFKESEIKNAKLILWGTGDKQAGSIEQDLKKYVLEHQLKDRVIFAGHTLYPEAAFKIMNCFVLSSVKPEPFATTVIEAALAKVPIIATDIGGTAEFIRHEKNGLLIKADDTNQLSQALLRLMKDSSTAQKMAGQAYQDADEFREKVFIQKLEKYLLI